MRRSIYSYRKGEKMSTTNEQKVYEILDLLGIKYTKYEHNPIYTVEEAQNLDIDIPGGHCKIFLLGIEKEIPIT